MPGSHANLRKRSEEQGPVTLGPPVLKMSHRQHSHPAVLPAGSGLQGGPVAEHPEVTPQHWSCLWFGFPQSWEARQVQPRLRTLTRVFGQYWHACAQQVPSCPYSLCRWERNLSAMNTHHPDLLMTSVRTEEIRKGKGESHFLGRRLGREQDFLGASNTLKMLLFSD